MSCDNVYNIEHVNADTINLYCCCEDCGCGGGIIPKPNPEAGALITLLGSTQKDYLIDVIADGDSYVACGFWKSITPSGAYAPADALAVRFDSELRLTNKFSPVGTSYMEHFDKVVKAKNGGHVFCGAYRNDIVTGYMVESNNDMLVTKQKIFGPPDWNAFIPRSMGVTPNNFIGSAAYVSVGACFLQASTASSVPHIRTHDSNLNTLKQFYVKGFSGFFLGVLAVEDGFIALAGSGADAMGNSVCAIKFDPELNITHKLILNGIGSGRLTHAVQIEGGYALAGYSSGVGSGSYDVFVVTVDNELKVTKKVAVGGIGSEILYGFQKDAQGNYLLSGSTSSVGLGGTDGFLCVLDPSLKITQQLVFGGNGDDVSGGVCIGKDGNYAVVGSTQSAGAGNEDAFIALFNKDFSKVPSQMAKYPAIRINTNPGFQAKHDISFTADNNPTGIAVAATNISNADLNLPIDYNPSLTVDAGAIV